MFKDDADKKAICRDYLRNSCYRGDKCKFEHPAKKYVFCHDYQNGKCKRSDCMFVHCSRDDEEHYNQFGQLPPHLTELPQLNQIPADNGEVPLCKDYLKGECTRLVCKFRHVLVDNGHREVYCNEYEQHSQKRRRYEHEEFVSQYETPQQERMVLISEQEYSILRKTVVDLKRRVDDLQATNEFLLEQNAKMRLTEKTATGITAMTVPTVTITNAPAMPQVNAAIPTVTASVATVPVSIAAVAATPVSLAGVSMAQGAVQIAPPSVSMAQQHDHDTTVTQTLQAASLVSYPLVARPVLQPH